MNNATTVELSDATAAFVRDLLASQTVQVGHPDARAVTALLFDALAAFDNATGD